MGEVDGCLHWLEDRMRLSTQKSEQKREVAIPE